MSESAPQSASRRSQRLAVGCFGIAAVAVLALSLFILASQNHEDQTATVAQQPTAGTANAAPRGTSEARAQSAKLVPSPTAPVAALVVPSSIDRRPIPETAAVDYQRLLSLSAPIHDYFATAERLGGFGLGDRQVAPQPATLGERRTFQTADGPRQADLVHLTEFATYWVETGLVVDPATMAEAAQTFESRYLPGLQAAFGREWSPGVDLDPRITVLHVLGSPDVYELGYFTDQNEFPRSLFIDSNEVEMVYLNMSRLEVGSDLYYGTLLHEMQHLSQWNMDANEAVWLNEGLSQLAETMAGLDTVDPTAYLEQPHIRLDRWSTAASDVYAHYAASYLYLLYLWQRAGESAVRELARHPANGLAGIQAILEGYLPGVSLEQFSLDWAVSNYLDSQSGPSPYGYDMIELGPPALATRARRLPFSTLGELEQFAVDYIDLDLSGRVGITFIGDTVAPLVSGPPPSGERFWLASLNNSSHAIMTTEVDLTDVAAPQLAFDAWYDLEPGWDYAYLTVSADGGATWKVLEAGYSMLGPYGPAWNGVSDQLEPNRGGWVRETVSLETYVGRTILLRFEALSDFEEPSRGFAMTNAVVTGADGDVAPIVWQADGFAETGWLLPQQWGVGIVREGEPLEIVKLLPDETGLAYEEIELGSDGGVVIVMPLTAPSSDTAQYWLGVEALGRSNATGAVPTEPTAP